MGLMDRVRGKVKFDSVILNGVPQNQIDSLSSSPLALPTTVFEGEDSGDPVRAFVTTITFNRNQTDDTGIEVIANRSTIIWHLEDTAGALFTSASLAFSGHTSGNTAVGLVTVDSTLSYISGRVLCSSTGVAHIAIGTSSGDASTARMFLTLPNGAVVAGSTLLFAT